MRRGARTSGDGDDGRVVLDEEDDADAGLPALARDEDLGVVVELGVVGGAVVGAPEVDEAERGDGGRPRVHAVRYAWAR